MPSLIAFFSATFALTWACWLMAGALARSTSGGALGSGLPGALLYLGIFAPAIIGLALTHRFRGRAGLHDLLARLFRWRVAFRWYVFALSYLTAVKLFAAGAHRLTSGAWPAFGFDAWYVLLAGTVLSTVAGGQAGEEIGWRGYALPRLERLMGLGAGSIVLGALWATWHLPLFYLPDADTFGQSFPLYVVQVTGMSVAMGWLHAGTGGSLLLAMLMHSALNNTSAVVPGISRPAANPWSFDAPLLGWLTAGAIWVAAAWFLVRLQGGRASPTLIPPAGYQRDASGPPAVPAGPPPGAPRR